MKTQNLKIQYIYHSGFIAETASSLLVFDYYQGTIGFENVRNTKNDKKIYVFSSHAHSDHFNPVIFEWQKERPGIQYILSSDIRDKNALPKEKDNMSFLAPYEEKQLNGLDIKAFNSTDEGVSFLVQCDGIRIFHAGDLNWWSWWDDTPEGIEKAEKDFKAEIAKIKGRNIDLAFFPVDPRLEQHYNVGGEYFIQEIKPKIFVPMHFGEDYSATHKFKSIIENQGSSTQVIELTHRGQEIVF